MAKYVVGTGFATLDRIYAAEFEEPVEALGGSCANVLVSLAMLGHKATPILTLGADETGKRLVDEMQRAGCITQFVFRDPDVVSPVTIEYLDLERAQHSFSSVCPETYQPFASYRPLEKARAELAIQVIRSAAVFYVDRLSPAILQMMEAASEAGAVVLFEPNSIKDFALFRKAIKLVDILKVSEEIASKVCFEEEDGPEYFITTLGRSGLSLATAAGRLYFPSIDASRVVDTCGAGDMVTTGLIHALLNADAQYNALEMGVICRGLVAGQWLAKLNCAFIGARGLFHAFDSLTIRSALMDAPDRDLDVMSVGPFAGY